MGEQVQHDDVIMTASARFVEVQNLVSKSGNAFCIATFHISDTGAVKCFVPPEIFNEVQTLVFGCSVKLGFALRVDSRLTLGLALVTVELVS